MASEGKDKSGDGESVQDEERPSYPPRLRQVPEPARGGVPHMDARALSIFHQWLRSMATDAEAALAAAMSYRELGPSGRDQWLRSLQGDIEGLNIPKIAIFAPLLSVEQDPERRQLLERLAFQDGGRDASLGECKALTGHKNHGELVYVLICPLYLDFAQVLACGVFDGCFVWVRHDPIVACADAPVAGDLMQGVRLEDAVLGVVLDDLAGAVLSHQRRGLQLPEAVYMLSDLLGKIGP